MEVLRVTEHYVNVLLLVAKQIKGSMPSQLLHTLLVLAGTGDAIVWDPVALFRAIREPSLSLLPGRL